ncbi:MAG: YeeE/YedE family protein [Agriterribacter sp.]
MIDIISKPWPWHVAGVIIGLIVPALLVAGNKHFGISANFRHLCAACFPSNISFFKYEWKKEIWNFFFVGGIFTGAVIATWLLPDKNAVVVHHTLVKELASYGINDYSRMVPEQLVSFEALFSFRGLIMMVGGGFLVGFGSRYAGGCTSGHAIMGLSNLQWPSLIATCCFMLGGFIMTNLLLPFILAL